MNQSRYIQSLKNVIFSKLINLGIVKSGSFTLKNGTQSSIYMDLRMLVSYPQLFPYLAKLLFLEYPQLLDTLTYPTQSRTSTNGGKTKLIPIPLGGLPFGFYLAYENKLPLLMIRDKAKEHGTKKLIEGVISPDDKYILVEDVITSGTSIIEALENISGHIATNHIQSIICICNRGGLTNILNIPIYSIFTLEEIQDYITNYLLITPLNNTVYTYFHYGNVFCNKLYQLALVKQSNIILSCDFITHQEILDIILAIGDKIIAVKLHLDILGTSDVDYETNSSSYIQFINELNKLKNIYNFLVIEDAKYADIDSIMIEKINHSQLGITKVADAFTMHAIAGLSILEGDKIGITAIVVAEMSSSNNLIAPEYTEKIRDAIRTTSEKKISMLGGLVCQSRIPQLLEPFEIATMSPGINLESDGDSHNQQYKIPSLADGDKLGLFWIVGRGITIYKNNTEKLKEVMNLYQSRGWDYFIKY